MKYVQNVERASFESSECKERHIIASHMASSSASPTLEEALSEFYCPTTESNEKSWQHSIFLRLFENLVIRNCHRQTWNPCTHTTCCHHQLEYHSYPRIHNWGGSHWTRHSFQDNVEEESMLCHLRAWKQIPCPFPKAIPSNANETKLRDSNTPANA